MLAARDGDYALLMQRFNAGLLVMALIALLIARRVIPFFVMRAVTGLTIPAQTRSGQMQLAACASGVIFLLADLPLSTAVALGLAGALAWWQVATWKPYAVRGNPLLWIFSTRVTPA